MQSGERVERFMEPRLVEDRDLVYYGRAGEELRCRARLYRVENGAEYLLVATETGFGVSRTIDRIASAVVRMWEINTDRFRMVEHYDFREARDLAPGEPTETFAFVSFDWVYMRATNPQWTITSRECVEEILGEQKLW